VKGPAREQVAVFADAAAFRAWLLVHHAERSEVWVGYYRKGSGRTALSYPEAVEEALCFGWIDGIGYRIDAELHANRFTPRRRGSAWSALNIARVAALTAAGRMHAAGLAAFESRDRRRDLPPPGDDPLRGPLPVADEERLRESPAAWAFWQSRTPGYRRQAGFWVQSARRPETRERRLATLITDSAAGRPIKPLAYGRAAE